MTDFLKTITGFFNKSNNVELEKLKKQNKITLELNKSDNKFNNFLDEINNIMNDIVSSLLDDENGEEIKKYLMFLNPQFCNNLNIFLGDKFIEKLEQVNIHGTKNKVYIKRALKACESDNNCNKVISELILDEEKKVSKKKICEYLAIHYIRIFNLISSIMTAVSPEHSMAIKRMNILYEILEDTNNQFTMNSKLCTTEGKEIVKEHFTEESGMYQLMQLYLYNLLKVSETPEDLAFIKDEYNNLAEYFRESRTITSTNENKIINPLDNIILPKSDSEPNLNVKNKNNSSTPKKNISSLQLTNKNSNTNSNTNLNTNRNESSRIKSLESSRLNNKESQNSLTIYSTGHTPLPSTNSINISNENKNKESSKNNIFKQTSTKNSNTFKEPSFILASEVATNSNKKKSTESSTTATNKKNTNFGNSVTPFSFNVKSKEIEKEETKKDEPVKTPTATDAKNSGKSENEINKLYKNAFQGPKQQNRNKNNLSLKTPETYIEQQKKIEKEKEENRKRLEKQRKREKKERYEKENPESPNVSVVTPNTGQAFDALLKQRLKNKKKRELIEELKAQQRSLSNNSTSTYNSNTSSNSNSSSSNIKKTTPKQKISVPVTVGGGNNDSNNKNNNNNNNNNNKISSTNSRLSNTITTNNNLNKLSQTNFKNNTNKVNQSEEVNQPEEVNQSEEVNQPIVDSINRFMKFYEEYSNLTLEPVSDSNKLVKVNENFKLFLKRFIQPSEKIDALCRIGADENGIIKISKNRKEFSNSLKQFYNNYKTMKNNFISLSKKLISILRSKSNTSLLLELKTTENNKTVYKYKINNINNSELIKLEQQTRLLLGELYSSSHNYYLEGINYLNLYLIEDFLNKANYEKQAQTLINKNF
jgi:hypothetical protein